MGTVSDVIVAGTEGAVQQSPVRAKVINDLSADEKERYKADIRATNILLQGIPKDIYSLINHYTDAKDKYGTMCRVLLEGIEAQWSDMRNIKMTMPRMQLNSKFVNNMLPEWSRFITEVKLNRGSNGLCYSSIQHNQPSLLHPQLTIPATTFNWTRANSEKQCNRNVIAGKVRSQKQRRHYQSGQAKPITFYNRKGLGHISREMSKAKATSMIQLLQGQDILFKTPGEWCSTGMKNSHCFLQENRSALYNGHEIVKTNHAPPVVHDSEDTREIAEITRKRMLEKMKSPLCVENKVKIAPPDYSKENLLATFAPQRDLTPEQIFWSKDVNEIKRAETSVPKPLSALTVYPPNTPVKLVPRVLPTKSQVKINLYTLTQLFMEFDKTCKKRITPTGLTEGERGFEQTKRCYLTEVIPFFKTLKQHFEGVQKALFKEVKGMEEIFDQMSAEVDQNTVDKQCAEIERKNLLIANENLIANCLSNQLMFAVEQSRCLDLEAEISKLQNENQKDVNDEMIRGFNKLEVEYLNLQLKYQHLQENFRNNKSQTSQDVPEFDSFFRIKILETQLQEKDNAIRNLKAQVSKMNDRSCETYNAKDVTALIEQNECVRVELEKVKQHYKELYDSIKITRVHTREKTSTMLNEIESLKAQLKSKVSCITGDSVKPKVLAPGMYAIDVKPIPHPFKNNRSAHLNYTNHLKESVEREREIVEDARVVKPRDSSLNCACRYTKLSQELVNTSTEASGSKPRSNTKKNRIMPAKSENKKKVEDHPRTNKSVWTKVNRVDFSISSKRVVINSNSESVCKTCNKCLNSASHEMCVVNILNSMNATPTVKIVLNKGKQIWKPKGKLSDNSLNKTKQVWKATGKLFANVGYQWRSTRKKVALGKLNYGYQWRPTGKIFALGELCPLTMSFL
ncbi:hypothetical protein Tco_0661035 [Tanacetum coccineum]